MVNPNAISDNDVLTTDIRVRSLLSAVRSKDMAVLFEANSVLASWPIMPEVASAAGFIGQAVLESCFRAPCAQ